MQGGAHISLKRMRTRWGALRHAKLTIPPWFPNDLGTFFLRIATLRRNHAECTGACLDDFEDVIFLRRKIVNGMAPGQYSASMGVTVLLTTTKSLLLYNNDFCILLHCTIGKTGAGAEVAAKQAFHVTRSSAEAFVGPPVHPFRYVPALQVAAWNCLPLELCTRISVTAFPIGLSGHRMTAHYILATFAKSRMVIGVARIKVAELFPGHPF